MSAVYGIYGHLPAILGIESRPANQLSPLLPGSVPLEIMAGLSGITMVAPPGTVERQYVLAMGLRALAPGAPFIALAHKDKGGSRLARELEQFGCVIEEEARKHHRICKGTRPQSLAGTEEAVAAGGPQFVAATNLWSQPGVFSWNRPDPGSALLLQHLPPLTGRGVDLGCGIGTLALHVLASPDVTHLTLVDSDRRAIDAAKRNVTDPRAEFRWTDLRMPPTDLTQLDFVVMNPPFHDGGMEDKTLGQFFVKSAAAMLRPGGQCWITANRHLPYEGVMQHLFRTVTPVIETDGFKIYRAEK